MAYHLLPQALQITQFYKLFDTCNSLSFKDSKICRWPMTSSSPHLKEMEEGVRFVKSMRVVNGAIGEDSMHYLKCLKGWCILLNAILELWSRLHGYFSISFLVTRQLNQDPLENFFGSIRQQGGNSDNPTPIQFKRAYRKLFHTNLLRIASANCEVDENKLLTELADIQNIPDLAPVDVGPLKIVTSAVSILRVEFLRIML